MLYRMDELTREEKELIVSVLLHEIDNINDLGELSSIEAMQRIIDKLSK